MSETRARDTGIWKKRIDHAVALSSPDHVPDFYVQLHQFRTDFGQALVRAYQRISARLP